MALGRNFLRSVGMATLSILLIGCAKERPVKPILPNGKRVMKVQLAGTYSYLKSISDLKFPGTGIGGRMAPGFYLEGDQLIQFVVKEKTLDIIAIDPLFKEESSALRNTVLASFPVRHVDVLRRQNADGDDTHEEEETETRRIWNEREYVIIDISQDLSNFLQKETKSVSAEGSIEIDASSSVINFENQRHLNDDTVLNERYSFKRFTPSATYAQKEYPRSVQDRFGVFKTVTYQFDKYGRITNETRKEYMNRWDVSKGVVYHLSKDFPAHLIPAVKGVFNSWNKAFKEATGKESILELKENSGQELGDMRYNLIFYENSTAGHNLLGYGPSITNPRTGEIVKADVILYGGTLRRSLHNERIWSTLLSNKSEFRSAGVLSFRHSELFSLTGISDLDSLKQNLRMGLDTEMLKNLKTSFEPTVLLKSLRSSLLEEHRKRMTSLNEDLVMTSIRSQDLTSILSDDEIESRIFTPLLAHELGHNLGLRHNFMGSADGDHFAEGSKSSSVMDYGFMATSEPMGPGPYDVAVINAAYGPSGIGSLLTENFLFCTDENILDSRNGLCNQFDAGRTLGEVIKNQFNRYEKSYEINNRRLDRVFFGNSNQEYFGRLVRNLLPMRMVFDHANAVVNANKALREASDVEETLSALFDLWSLLRRRIESDGKSLPQNTVRLSVADGVTALVDTAKIAAIAEEAKEARVLVFQSLATIVSGFPNRPNFDTVDPIHFEVQTKGILQDRIVALLLAGLRFPDPLSGGGSTTLFEPMTREVGTLFGSIISNTVPVAGGSFRRQFFDINLRELALDLVANEMSVAGLAGAEAKEILRLERVTASDTATVKEISDIRARLVELITLLNLGGASLPPLLQQQIRQEIAQLRTKRNQINLATMAVGENTLKAPISLLPLGFNLDTATGHLMRDNLNPFEDSIGVIRNIVTELGELIKNEKDPIAKAELEAERNGLVEVEGILVRFVSLEASFLGRIYRIYDPR